MNDGNFLICSMEDLLTICSRSIVAPDMIMTEVNRIMSIVNDRNLEQKFIVRGCESLSFLASGFLRSGYDSFISVYERKTGINHTVSGFSNKDELIQYCEFCVEYGEESLVRLRKSLLAQLEIENRMTKAEICSLNIRRFEESYGNLLTVQDHITSYIKLSLLVNSLKEFFKKYYKGMN
jgi:hypothetical protein